MSKNNNKTLKSGLKKRQTFISGMKESDLYMEYNLGGPHDDGDMLGSL